MKKHIIKNYRSLNTTLQRKNALDILEAGLFAVNTEKVITTHISYKKNILIIGRKKYNLNTFNNVYIIGIGKTAYTSAKTLEKILGSNITDGVILDVQSGFLKHMTSIKGTHPFPSLSNMKATGQIIALLKNVDSRDLIITIISGGGSALLCWPYDMKCDELSSITKMMMKKGATIHEINTVRKHLSEIQGGQFAKLAYPATVASLIFSDVPNNDLGMIASGPTILDTTTIMDAAHILTKYNIINKCKLPNCNLKETPKDPIFFRKVQNELLVSNKVAVNAMKKEAQKLGYKAKIYATDLQGEASEIGAMLASLVRPGEAIITAGETTVTIKGKGKGGRNQELVLGGLSHLHEDTLLLSCASDGIDNTNRAGAFIDMKAIQISQRKKLNPASFLKSNNSFNFFQQIQTQINTGITGINISDLMLVLREK